MTRRIERLRQDYVLLKVDEAPPTSLGGIVLTRPHPARTGKVLMVGPGRRYPDRFVATDVQVGDSVAFFIASADTKQGRALRYFLAPDEVLLREPDILFAYDGSVHVEV